MRCLTSWTWLGIGLALTSACGADTKQSRTEYYIEPSQGDQSSEDGTAATPTPAPSQTGQQATAGTTPGTNSTPATQGTNSTANTGGSPSTPQATPSPGTANSTGARPMLSLIAPNGGDLFVAGTAQPITFDASEAGDANGTNLMFKLEYSSDSGNTWTKIVEGLKQKSYDWDVTGLAQLTTYKVRVTATDSQGGIGSAVSANNFGVATAPITFATSFGALLKQRCAGCHDTGRSNAGAFTDDNFNLGNIGVRDQAADIVNDVMNNKMPPGAPLSKTEKDMVLLWSWGGST